MDGGSASIPLGLRPPSSSLMEQIRHMLNYVEDRDSQVSLLKSIIKRKQEDAIPAEIPRDLILEAKIRIGEDNKEIKERPSDEDLLHVEREKGFTLTDEAIAELNNGRSDVIPDSIVDQATCVFHEKGSMVADMEIAALKNQSYAAAMALHVKEVDARSGTWSALFQHHTDGSRDLHRHDHPSMDPDHHIEFDDADSSAAVQNWGNALVGYFIGNPPPIFEIKNCLSKAWRIKDLEIIPMAEGFLLFKFHSYDVGQSILDDGPWFVYGRPLILRRWSEDITMYRENLETIPVWVRLPNLNFCFRTKSALSKIGSVIGNPICMDHATAAGTRYAFARICVEVNVDVEFPTELRMKYKDKTIIQKIEYAWKPNPCKSCRTFNHGDKYCPLKADISGPTKVWVPKKRQVEEPHVDLTERSEQPTMVTNDQQHITKVDSQQHITPEEDWNVVKGKTNSDRATSSTKKAMSSTTKKMATCISSNQEPNRFLSLSNLDGESNVSAEEIASTTALVVRSTEAGFTNTSSGHQQKHFSSIHQLDKSFLAKMQSTSAKIKPGVAGPSSKDQANHKNRST